MKKFQYWNVEIVSFFVFLISSFLLQLQFNYLQKVQLHRRFAAKHSH